jgi:hypothetical protein
MIKRTNTLIAILLIVVALVTSCELQPSEVILNQTEIPVTLKAYAEKDTWMLLYRDGVQDVTWYEAVAGDTLVVELIAKHNERLTWADMLHEDSYHLFYSIEQTKFQYQYDEVVCNDNCAGESVWIVAYIGSQ